MLSIPWPVRASDGTAVDVDVILATATRRAKTRPLPDDIANAWITEGGEEYFFENIRNGIRTPDDLLIWRQIVAANPTWLTTDTYAEAVAILRAEAV